MIEAKYNAGSLNPGAGDVARSGCMVLSSMIIKYKCQESDEETIQAQESGQFGFISAAKSMVSDFRSDWLEYQGLFRRF
jgi:hypothetical protein